MSSSTQQSAYFLAGTEATVSGIYVVSHYKPTHTLPHEVLIATPMILPTCNACSNADPRRSADHNGTQRFSLRSLSPEPIEDSEFFCNKDASKRQAGAAGRTFQP